MTTTKAVIDAITADHHYHRTCFQAWMSVPGYILSLSDARPFTDDEYLLDCAICPPGSAPTMTAYCDTEEQVARFFEQFVLFPETWEINRVRHYAELQERNQ